MDLTSVNAGAPDAVRVLRLLGVRVLGLAVVTALVGLPGVAIALTLLGAALVMARVRTRQPPTIG